MILTPYAVLFGNPGTWMIWFIIPGSDPPAYHLEFVEDE